MKKVILVTLLFSVLSTIAISSYAFGNGTQEEYSLNGIFKNKSLNGKAKINSLNETTKINVITGKGQVVLINLDRTMITLKHEPIVAINWPAMTMAFKVKNSAILAKTKVGDKVIFTLAPDGKNYMVTSIK